MNDSFFNLPPEKQRRILSAGYRVFGENRYAKAPMSEIASECGISKSLLFHYFSNKRELFLFLWDNAEKVTSEAKTKFRVYETESFFEALRRGLAAKCAVMRTYPYITLFSINAYYDDNPEVSLSIRRRVGEEEIQALNGLRSKTGRCELRADIPFDAVYREILYASEGMAYRWYRKGECDVDAFEKEYLEMIEHWEKMYSGGTC